MSYLIPKFHFQVNWGEGPMGFTEVTGLKFKREVIEYRDGLDPEYAKVKLPGMRTNEDVTFKRGVVKGSNEFFDWWNSTKLATVDKRDVTVEMLDEEHQPIVQWTIQEAWPNSVEATDLNADSNEISVETLILSHNGIRMEHL